MGMADLHIHSNLGDGMAPTSHFLDYVERETDLDVIAITDHNDLSGSLQARELVRKGRYRFQVVTGMEVTTEDGHLLALFLESPVPPSLPMARTLEMVHAQGGLGIVAHPMSWLEGSLGQGALDRLIALDEKHRPDGLEVFNARLNTRGYIGRARRLNEKRYKLAEVGSSDAHHLSDLGRGYSLFPGRTTSDLKRAILERTTQAQTGWARSGGRRPALPGPNPSPGPAGQEVGP